MLKIDEKYFKEQDELYIYNKGLWVELKEIYENQLKEIQEIENEFIKLGMPKEKIEELISNLKTQYVFLEKIPKHFNEMLQEQFNLTSKEIDALIIDESSMADIETMGRLLGTIKLENLKLSGCI